ncbi:hypothetical protein RclHR1_04820015 [Rhizophagus clarus]|uniref:Uncharacterized protein n=1 Tax=Rhizophagus clarus TaxID=94130 RepID=A0A2Z6SCR0_9GLOM|nr:hypothetical protein RclHR1_04820015 [Rhizophagus clarus]GES81916.1 hypothetical protein GLOIN_2v1638699 [Rhizophagus clarus]
MRLFSFLLFHINFLVVLVSSCSPETKDGNLISTSLSFSSNWRFNILFYTPVPAAIIGTFNSGNQPADNEIFELKQPTIGVYEFRAFISFYRTSTIEIPTESINNVGDPFKINYSTSGNNQRFSIECETCNLNSNSENWVKYHSSCLIKNLASGLCATGKDLVANVTQADCAIASRWDLFGMISPDIPTTLLSTPTSVSPTATNSMGEISMSGKSAGIISTGGLIGVVFGSIIGSAFITLAIGYWFIKDRILFFKNELINNDPVNVQIIDHN